MSIRIPAKLELLDIQTALRDVDGELDRGIRGSPDLHGRRFLNVGDGKSSAEFATVGQLRREIDALRAELEQLKVKLRPLGA